MEKYTDREQFKKLFDKLLIDEGLTKREVAKRLGVSPQGLQNLLNKKQLSFEDVQRISDAIGYDLFIELRRRSAAAGGNTVYEKSVQQNKGKLITVRTETKESVPVIFPVEVK